MKRALTPKNLYSKNLDGLKAASGLESNSKYASRGAKNAGIGRRYNPLANFYYKQQIPSVLVFLPQVLFGSPFWSFFHIPVSDHFEC